MTNDLGASVPDQALAVPVEPVARLDPSGFDPSRLEDAIAFAAHHHKGQRDKGGQPYILHPLRVMMMLDHEDERIAAVLHDVVEDCGVELFSIRMGYGDAVADAVDALTRRDGEGYIIFIERCRANEIARAVKLADLSDNMNLLRLPKVTEEDLKRQRKYGAARDILNAASGIETEGQDGATRLGAKHESPTPQGDAQEQPLEPKD